MTDKGTGAVGIEKCPTGIRGLDEITRGGLPRGRPTLVCGGPGSGKTLLATEFVVRGARDLGEPGVFMAFEETERDLAANVASMGFDLPALIEQGKLALDYVYIERSEIEQTGEYDLEGLFVRLGAMIDSIGARRVAIDSLEALFAGLPDEGLLRAELRRLMRWLKDKGVTAVITGERGEGVLTRHGLEEYVSDCVIYLDHRVVDQVATRRLRIVKYRGSAHEPNEYPTLIDQEGLSVLPITSLGLEHEALDRRVSTGVAALDGMLGGDGYFAGSSVLITGTAGAGKTSLAAAFADGICRGDGRCLYWSSEESPEQIIRNVGSIGIDLAGHVRDGRLKIHAARPTARGLERQIVVLHRLIDEFDPQAVVMDPISNLSPTGTDPQVRSMLTRVIDYLKGRGVTSVFTNLTAGGRPAEQTEVGVSSLIDTWLLLRMREFERRRRRELYVLKSRGMAHSHEIRELLLSEQGIDLAQPAAAGTRRDAVEVRDPDLTDPAEAGSAPGAARGHWRKEG